MAALTRFLDDTPRIRLLEALSKAGKTEFTRAELAREAGQWRATVNRTIKDLERDGIVLRQGPKTRPTYSVNPDSVNLRLLAYFDAALRMADRRGPAEAATVLSSFQQAVDRVVPRPSIRVGHVMVPVFAELTGPILSQPALSESKAEIKSPASAQNVETGVLDAATP